MITVGIQRSSWTKECTSRIEIDKQTIPLATHHLRERQTMYSLGSQFGIKRFGLEAFHTQFAGDR